MRIVVAVVVSICLQAGLKAQPSTAPDTLDVCVVASSGLPLNQRERKTTLTEAAAAWRTLDVGFRWVAEQDDHCQRVVMVKSDAEAEAGEIAHDGALGWVPFVEGRARQLVFLRVTRARQLIASAMPGPRSDDLASYFAARLLGRALAHEMGHALLHLRTHTDQGLMRPVLQPQDILKSSARWSTLSAAERLRMRAALDTELRLAAR